MSTLAFWIFFIDFIARTLALETFHRQCAYPQRSIPDIGSVVSTMYYVPEIPHSIVRQVEVEVSLDHTWIGDLTVTLLHEESDRSVKLFHQPCGPCSSTSNLDVTFKECEHPISCDEMEEWPSAAPEEPLTAFRGVEADGTWKLMIDDNSLPDEGVLNSWCLRLSVDSSSLSPKWYESSVQPFIPIHARNPTTSSIQVNMKEESPVFIQDLQVAVDLNMKASPLEMRLVFQNVSVILLKDSCDLSGYALRFNDEGADFVCDSRRHTESDESLSEVLKAQEPLSAFDGMNPNGLWTLKIQTFGEGVTGTLRGWTLFLRY